jgi:hypothetical protein
VLRLRPIGPALIAIVLGLAGAVLSSSGGAGQYQALLDLESSAVYTLRPDQGSLHVSFEVTATRAATGTTAVDRIELPVVPGATNIGAATDDGQALDVRAPVAPGGQFTRVTVLFGRALTPGEEIHLLLSYDLREAGSSGAFISDTLLYVPILAIGDPATVELDLPDDRQWYSIVEPRDCERTGAVAEQRFTCTGSSDVYVAAVVQLIDQQQYRTLEATVETNGGAQTFELRYEAGHEGWAQRVRSLALSGLPVLESIVGVPLELREEFTLLEVGPTDLGGYDGVFQCIEEEACRIGIVRGASDHVVLHELAHLWTTELDRRWLSEGLAEFAALRAARELGLAVEPPSSLPAVGDVYLDEWGDPLLTTAATDEAILQELAGYREAVRLFEDVEARIGLDSMRGAIAFADALETVDSRAFLDLLEATSGADLTDLFRERVFTPSFSPVLDQRAKAKVELATLIDDAARSEFELRTDPIDAAIRDWSFSVALDAVDDAYGFIDAYPAALEAKTRVSFWGRLGLIGKDPDGALDDAREQFDQGNFDRAAGLARSTEHAYATAGQAARDRALVALAVAVLGGVLIAGGTWALRGGSS